MKNKIFTTVMGVAIFFLIITVSISIPIYFRFFYYMLINPLDIESATGHDYQTIKSAYDQLLNYLTLPWAQFSTGVFKCSAEGKAHFVDCKALFNLNVSVLLISAVTVITLLILNAKKVIKFEKIKGFGVSFYSAVAVLSIFVLLALIVSIDFNKAFVVFHKIFFPGKDNWLFDPFEDEIINALPQVFFLLCAILIVSGIIIISTSIIVYQVVQRRKRINNSK